MIPFREPRLIPPFFYQTTLEPLDFGGSVKNKQIITNSPFERKVRFVPERDKVFVNIHAYPNWLISVNGETKSSMDYFYNNKIDKLGRPKLLVVPGAPYEVTIEYTQTVIERVANAVSVVTFVAYISYLLYRIRRRESKR